MALTEPITGVIDLNFKKVNGRMPIVVTELAGEETNLNTGLLYIREDPHAVPSLANTYTNVLTDCDGDALWVTWKFPYFINMRIGMTRNPYNFPTALEEDGIQQLNWDEGIEVEGQKLLTTIIMDPSDSRGGYPLGVAYSSRQSLMENFRLKRIRDRGGSLIPESYSVLTLYSRSRGIWPKGLGNPNQDKDAPLPEELEISSGNFLFFRKMFTTMQANAIMLAAEVPYRHGFCHESYLYDETAKSLTVYESDQHAPKGARLYRSCFHKVLMGSRFLRFVTD